MFAGDIFDVRAYDVARTALDIQGDMNQLPTGTEDNLTGAWHLDDVQNGTTDQFRDVSGNGGTGTYSGSTPVFEDTNLFTMAEESTLLGRIIATDIDGDSQQDGDTDFDYAVTAQGANGFVTVYGDGTWEYTPNIDFFGTDSFELKVIDSLGATATKTVTVSVLNINDAPVVNTVSAAPVFTEDGAPVLVDPAVQVTDGDSADFDGGILSVDVSTGYAPGDTLAFDGTVTLSAGMTNGSLVSLDGGTTTIGTINIDGTGGTLTVDLTDSATPALIEQLARTVTFENTSIEPGTTPRTVSFTLSDGDGGTSLAVDQTVAPTCLAY